MSWNEPKDELEIFFEFIKKGIPLSERNPRLGGPTQARTVDPQIMSLLL